MIRRMRREREKLHRFIAVTKFEFRHTFDVVSLIEFHSARTFTCTTRSGNRFAVLPFAIRVGRRQQTFATTRCARQQRESMNAQHECASRETLAGMSSETHSGTLEKLPR